MTTWVSAELTADHDLGGFRSGREELDRWLVEQALRAQAAGAARTVVWTAETDTRVLAFYSLAPTQLAREQLPSRSFASGYSVIPGYLIARLALDSSLQGQGLGSELLVDALELIVIAAAAAGGRVIAVDAVDEAAHAFYRHHNFQSIKGSRRLVMKVATARALFEV